MAAVETETKIISLLEERIASGSMSAASISVSQNGRRMLEWCGGTTEFFGQGDPITQDHVFYLTSITKALVFTAAATLLQEGAIDLRDPVAWYVPKLDTEGKRSMQLIHLFTHTSGLPEFAPNDQDLRKNHAALPEFLEAAFAAPLLFEPGTQHQYSNLGTHILAHIAEAVLGKPMPQILEERVFGPLGMAVSHLGWREDFLSRSVKAKSLIPSDWDHNSDYWRGIAAPWAGAHSTAGDLKLLLNAFLDDGVAAFGEQVIAPSIIDLFGALDLAPAAGANGQQWALGWQVQTRARSSGFGSLVPPGVFGHTGAAGTIMWCDRKSRTAFVLLTNGRRSGAGNEDRALKSCSNMAAAWLC